MELGRIAEIDIAKDSHVEKIQTIKEVDDKHKVIQDDQYKKAQGKTEEKETNEVVLDNIRFGYNANSKDFYVKIKRGDSEYTYPTEAMMRVKANIAEVSKQQNQDSE